MIPAGVKVVPDVTELYPDSDGRRMSENTKQYRRIAVFKNGIDAIIGPMPNVMSAADNLIYALEGRPKVRTAPDVYVSFGRPKGDRGSYKVWKEGGIFPQVVVEILSPGNRPAEMARKMRFYETFGAEEYYIYEPDDNTLEIFLRDKAGEFSRVSTPHGFVSPRLGMRFDLSGPVLVIYKPNGEPFLTVDELEEQRQRFKRQAAQATARADQEQARADELKAKAEAEREKAERLAAKLRELGIDPTAL